MKFIMILILLLNGLIFQANATSVANPATSCSYNQLRVWTQNSFYGCVPTYPSPSYQDCVICQMNYLNMTGAHQPYYFNNFPPALYQPNQMPWWAYQGNMYYPNFHYPGAWTNNHVNNNHYDGGGNVYALKPNIYVESIHKEKKFTFIFPSSDRLSFLATTPLLDDEKIWKGKIVNGDRFEIDYVNYDYLFYDLRLPQEKMQFNHGLCVASEDLIVWMLDDLKAMSYPKIALQDFEEHWSVKIPKEYPYYCIYPQYNTQLDEILPVQISLEQSEFVRVLYLLVPHKEQPSVHKTNAVPLPTMETDSIRPKTVVKRENSFKEWGVAFLGE